MIVRHYNRNQGNRKRRREHPDAELNRLIAEREATDLYSRENATCYSGQALRGSGVVSPPSTVKFTRPRRVRRNQGYYTGGKSGQSTFYPYEPAPYLEFAKDVARNSGSRGTARTNTPKVVAELIVPETAMVKLRDHNFND